MHRDLARAREAEMMARAHRAELIRQAHREDPELDETQSSRRRWRLTRLARRFATG
jgi:hypothetical protein